MSLLTFGAPTERAWRIVEIRPGVWRGEMHRRGAGIIRQTGDGSFVDVRECVERHRDALPLTIRHLRSVSGEGKR